MSTLTSNKAPVRQSTHAPALAWQIAGSLQWAATKLEHGSSERALLESIVDALSVAGDTER